MKTITNIACPAFALSAFAYIAASPSALAVSQHESGDYPSVRGSQWVWQNPLPQGNYIYQVSCVDANNGMAAGDNGTIVIPSDGGNNWSTQTSKKTNNGNFKALYEV